MAIKVYTIKNCPYCERAKILLTSKNVHYAVIDVTNNEAERRLLIEKSNGMKTVPQIFINAHHIGGFDVLNQLNKDGKLDLLIQQNDGR